MPVEQEEFVRRVKAKFKGQKMDNPPKGFDSDRAFYYKIGGLHYGPISREQFAELLADKADSRRTDAGSHPRVRKT